MHRRRGHPEGTLPARHPPGYPPPMRTTSSLASLALLLLASPRAVEADPHSPAFEKATLRLEEVASGSTARLMDRLPEMAARLAKASAPASAEATEPPKPLPTTPTKPAPKKS